jgi:hypothetical protein
MHPEDASKQGPALDFRNKILRALYAQETAEVKAKVERLREEGLPDSEDDLSDDSDTESESDSESIDPEEQQRRAKASAYQRYVVYQDGCGPR